jgi:hypothetical protein
VKKLKIYLDTSVIAVSIDNEHCLCGLFAIILHFKKPFITMVMRGF